MFIARIFKFIGGIFHYRTASHANVKKVELPRMEVNLRSEAGKYYRK